MAVRKRDVLKELEDRIEKEIIPIFKDRWNSLIGIDLYVELNFASIKRSVENYEKVLKLLLLWDGFFIFGQLAAAVEEMLQREDAEEIRGRFVDCVKKLIIVGKMFLPEEFVNEAIFTVDGIDHKRSNTTFTSIADINSTSVTLCGTDLTVEVIVSEGVAFLGDMLSRQFMLKMGTALGLCAQYFTAVVEDFILVALGCIQTEVYSEDFKIDIEVDWTSFEKAGSFGLCLLNFTEAGCNHSLMAFVTALQIVSHSGTPRSQVEKCIKKVVFKNNEEDGVEKSADSSYCYVHGTTLYIMGAYRHFKANVSPQTIARTIILTCSLDNYVEMFERGEKVTPEHVNSMIEVLREATTLLSVSATDFSPMLEIYSKKCLCGLSDEDRIAMELSLKQYWDEKNQEEPSDEDKSPETIIYGWVVDKINHRGQYQQRMLCLTQKAIYTFSYNAKKKESSNRRARRYPYAAFSSISYGPLDHDNNQGKFGINFKSNINNSKQEKDAEQQTSKVLRRNLFKVSKFLVFEHLIKRLDRVQDPKVSIPGMRQFDTPSSVCRIASKCFFLKDVQSRINIGFGEVDVSVALEILAELYQTLDQPAIDLPNLTLTLTNIILKIFEFISGHIDELDFVIPLDVSITSLLRLIEKSLVELPNRNEKMSMDIGFIPSLPFKDLIYTLKCSLNSFRRKDLEGLSLSHSNVTFSIPQIIEQLSQLKDIPDIDFPTYPRVGLLCLIRFAVSQMNKHFPTMPEVNVTTLKIPGIELPSVKISKEPNTIMKKLFASEPTRKELLAECVDGNGCSKWLSAQISYAIWSAASIYTRPHPKMSPIPVDSLEVPKSLIGSLYKKIAKDE